MSGTHDNLAARDNIATETQRLKAGIGGLLYARAMMYTHIHVQENHVTTTRSHRRWSALSVQYHESYEEQNLNSFQTG